MKKREYVVSANELKRISLPEETDTYKPISHASLIELVEESVLQVGFNIHNSVFKAAKDGNVATAEYTIHDIRDDEMSLMIGWQNSYDKSATLKFAIGAHIFICSNGCISSDFGAFKHKHTGGVQILTPTIITSYIETASEVFSNLQRSRDEMKKTQIDKRRAAELIGRMVLEDGIINPTQMNIIGRELKRPSFDYKSEGSLWQLYQYTTHALKTDHPSTWMQSHLLAHDFFLEELSKQTGISFKKDEQLSTPSSSSNQLTIFDEISGYKATVSYFDGDDRQHYETYINLDDYEEAENAAISEFETTHSGCKLISIILDPVS